MAISLTAFRQKLFALVDKVIKTGVPLEIERHGHQLRLVLDEKRSKLDNLTPHNAIVGDPEELVELKVSTWSEEKPAPRQE
jgi:Phd_YefM.